MNVDGAFILAETHRKTSVLLFIDSRFINYSDEFGKMKDKRSKSVENWPAFKCVLEHGQQSMYFLHIIGVCELGFSQREISTNIQVGLGTFFRMCGASEETDWTPLHHMSEYSHGSFTGYTFTLTLLPENCLLTTHTYTERKLAWCKYCRTRHHAYFHINDTIQLMIKYMHVGIHLNFTY